MNRPANMVAGVAGVAGSAQALAGLCLSICLLIPAQLAALTVDDAGVRVAAQPRGGNRAFPRSPRLARRIEFWKQIFTKYSRQQIAVHDSRYVDHVYSVLEVKTSSRRRIRSKTAAEKRRLRALLNRLDKRSTNPAQLNAEERRIVELFADVNERNKFSAAAKRIRTQPGLREAFTKGIQVSRRYLPEMERIFRGAGLPVELTRLPMIESTFDLRAYSYKGAAGVWQFMPRTGRLYGLRINRSIDERRDPIYATHAAAKYLRASYRTLGSWPLAITAYNHGARGIARGVRAVGSDDIADLIDGYRGRTFGFAGQNFYAEFLAVLDIDRRPERFLGQLTYERPRRTDELRVSHGIDVKVAAKAAGISTQEFTALNPALGGRIVRRGGYIPRHYRLRVPAGKRADFERHVVAWAAEQKSRMASSGKHRVRRGETLSDIAAHYGTSVGTLQRYNEIWNPRRLQVGQVIAIPRRSAGRGSVTTARASGTGRSTRTAKVVAVSPAEDGRTVHTIRRGETLYDIAAAYGVSTRKLERDNGIRNARRLQVGQEIVILNAPPRQTPEVLAGTERQPTPTAQIISITEDEDTAPEKTTVTEPSRPTEALTAAAATAEPPAAVATAPTEAATSVSTEPALMTPATPPQQTAPTAASDTATAPIQHELVRGETLYDLAQAHGTTVRALKHHNDIRNPRRLRAGDVIEIPVGATASAVPTAVAEADDAVRHRVRRGQTLSQIARRYGSSISDIQDANGIRNARNVRAGQVLVIPEPGAGKQVLASMRRPSDDGYIRHRVRRGQTLSHIARQYGTSVKVLKRHNGIRDARRLRIRQVIKIPPS